MINFGYGVMLYPINRADIETLRSWRNDPAIWRWTRQNDLISDADQERWFEWQSKEPTVKMYLIKDHDNKPVGVCGLTSIDYMNSRAEFSLYIAPRFFGNGYGKSALMTLFSHGFNNLGLHLIWGESFSGNPAMGLFEKLGMKCDGVRRHFYFRNGHFIDAHLYSITNEECYRWKAS